MANNRWPMAAYVSTSQAPCRVYSLGLRVYSLGLRVYSLGLRVYSLGLKV